MKNADLLAMISSGDPQVFTVDPLHKTHIQQKTLDAAMKEAKKMLSHNKPVRIVLLK